MELLQFRYRAPNLDGCMITVEGTPQNPTVYQANVANAPLILSGRGTKCWNASATSWPPGKTRPQHVRICESRAPLWQGATQLILDAFVIAHHTDCDRFCRFIPIPQ